MSQADEDREDYIAKYGPPSEAPMSNEPVKDEKWLFDAVEFQRRYAQDFKTQLNEHGILNFIQFSIKSALAAQNGKIEAIREAIENEGPSPSHHHAVMANHRKQWPTLWEAIDRALDSDGLGKVKG